LLFYYSTLSTYENSAGGLRPDTAKLSITSPPGQQSRTRKKEIRQCYVLHFRCFSVRHYQVLHFQVVQFGPSVSGLAVWFVIVRSCNVRSCIFNPLAFCRVTVETLSRGTIYINGWLSPERKTISASNTRINSAFHLSGVR